jgi:hypothetical protein
MQFICSYTDKKFYFFPKCNAELIQDKFNWMYVTVKISQLKQKIVIKLVFWTSHFRKNGQIWVWTLQKPNLFRDIFINDLLHHPTEHKIAILITSKIEKEVLQWP